MLDGRQVHLKALNLSLELLDGPLEVADRNGCPTGSSNLLAVERRKEESKLLQSLKALEREGSNLSVSTNQLSAQQPLGSFPAIDPPKAPAEALMKSIGIRAPVSNVMKLADTRDSRPNGLQDRGQTRTEESQRGLFGDLSAAEAKNKNKAKQFEQQVDVLMKRDRSTTSTGRAVQPNIQIAVQTSSPRPEEDATAQARMNEYQTRQRESQAKQVQAQNKRKAIQTN